MAIFNSYVSSPEGNETNHTVNWGSHFKKPRSCRHKVVDALMHRESRRFLSSDLKVSLSAPMMWYSPSYQLVYNPH